MKTQIVPGAYDSVFFPAPPAKSGVADRAQGVSPFFPRVASDPIATASISANTPAHSDHARLPGSLRDWLVCKEALEIRRRGRNQTEDGNDTWVLTAKPVTRGLMLNQSAADERKNSGRG